MPELRRGDASRAIGGMESGDAVVPDELVLRMRMGWAAPGSARCIAFSAGSTPSIVSLVAYEADEATTPLIDNTRGVGALVGLPSGS